MIQIPYSSDDCDIRCDQALIHLGAHANLVVHLHTRYPAKGGPTARSDVSRECASKMPYASMNRQFDSIQVHSAKRLPPPKPRRSPTGRIASRHLLPRGIGSPASQMPVSISCGWFTLSWVWARGAVFMSLDIPRDATITIQWKVDATATSGFVGGRGPNCNTLR